jgi:hypothetical protein
MVGLRTLLATETESSGNASLGIRHNSVCVPAELVRALFAVAYCPDDFLLCGHGRYGNRDLLNGGVVQCDT